MKKFPEIFFLLSICSVFIMLNPFSTRHTEKTDMRLKFIRDYDYAESHAIKNLLENIKELKGWQNHPLLYMVLRK